MVDIELKEGQTGYNAIGEYIQRYWEHNIPDTVIVSLGVSRNGNDYELRKEIAIPQGLFDIEFLYDWWEGEKFLRLFGIKTVGELDISGGIYMK